MRKQVEIMLDQMVDEKLLMKPNRGKYMLSPLSAILSGKIRITASGFAFVSIDGTEDDLYVSKSNINGAFHNDIVEVKLLKKGYRGRPRGRIVSIIKRARETFVGNIQITDGQAHLISNNSKYPFEIHIPSHMLNHAAQGDKAIARIVNWGSPHKKASAKIETVLGKSGNVDTEMKAIITEAGLPLNFPEKVEEQARAIGKSTAHDSWSSRRDFRKTPAFTIDPEDAKDFDDAISVKIIDGDLYEIGIHIADVSHYVRPGSEVDTEAQKRGTSVYLADRVIPMLPEILSNDLCSLKPGEDKLCFSVVFHITKNAVINHTWIGKTIIHSHHRFTYQEAQDNMHSHSGHFFNELRILSDIASKLRSKRIKTGGIEFETSDIKVIFDKAGRPIDFIVKNPLETNNIVEEFMLSANRAVAEYIHKQKGGGFPFVYRIHNTPDIIKIASFKRFVQALGYPFSHGKNEGFKHSINKLLQQIKGKREAFIIGQLAIRTMAKAIYSTANIGHYGLGFDYYCHFTSPIRRYPDLLVHRLLHQALHAKKGMRKQQLEALCKHCSEREIIATDAERSSIKFFQTYYMKNQIGKTFDGIVSGITEWGFYVELNETRSEGMIRFKDMDGDYYHADQDKHAIIGHNKGQKIRLGDPVTVIVEDVDLLQKKICFALVN